MPKAVDKSPKHSTTKPIALIILPFLCVYGLVALSMTYHLTVIVFSAYARGVAIDPSQVALITSLGMSGSSAMSIVGGSMIQTERPVPVTNIDKSGVTQTGPGATTTPPEGTQT